MIADNVLADARGLTALSAADSDGAWPRVEAPFWSPAAPRVVVEAYGAGDLAAAWKAWRKYLRKRPLQLTRMHDGKPSALAWGLVPPGAETRLGWLLQQLERKNPGKKTPATVAKYAEQSLHEPPAMPSDATAVEALTWLHLLASRPELFDGPRWWRILEGLSRLAASPAPPLEEDAVAEQIYRGELPLTLSWLFPEVEPCAALRAAAVEALSLGMSEILDGEGLPQSRFLPAFRPLVACWTRCRLIGEAIGHTAGDGDVLQGGCWKAEAEEQFPLAVREAVRLCRADGTAVLAQVECRQQAALTPALSQKERENAAPDGDDKARRRQSRRERRWLTEVAMGLVKNKPNRRLARSLADSAASLSADKAAQLPPSSVHSEWAEIGVLRTDWSRRATQLTAAYGQPRMQIELEIAGELLLSGPWDLEVSLDGAIAEPRAQWREVCWVSDADCDYLEIELELSHSLTVQRQMLLARNDQLLFLADAVLGEQPGVIAYRGRLPLAPRVAIEQAADTWELFCSSSAFRRQSGDQRRPTGGTPARALVLPLALPEWRSGTRDGSLSVEDGRLQLRQTWHGARLFAPLWFDLSRRRQNKPFTWRQLTVAEQRANQPRDVAVGYRIQFAKRQWLAYRSLKRPGNRTVLGQNLSTDFLLARFGRDGETQALVEVE